MGEIFKLGVEEININPIDACGISTLKALNVKGWHEYFSVLRNRKLLKVNFVYAKGLIE